MEVDSDPAGNSPEFKDLFKKNPVEIKSDDEVEDLKNLQIVPEIDTLKIDKIDKDSDSESESSDSKSRSSSG